MEIFKNILQPIFGHTWAEVTSVISTVLVIGLLIALIFIILKYKELKNNYKLGKEVIKIHESKIIDLNIQKKDLEDDLKDMQLKLEQAEDQFRIKLSSATHEYEEIIASLELKLSELQKQKSKRTSHSKNIK